MAVIMGLLNGNEDQIRWRIAEGCDYWAMNMSQDKESVSKKSIAAQSAEFELGRLRSRFQVRN